MGTYFLGSSIHLRGLYWNRALVVRPDPATALFSTDVPHGMTNGQTVALLSGAAGGLNQHDALGQFQVYYVVSATSTAFALAFALNGAPIVLTSSTAGTILVLADPTTPTVVVTPFDGVPITFTPAIEQAGMTGVYVYDYLTTQRGPSQTYEFDGGGGVVAAGKGTFNVV